MPLTLSRIGFEYLAQTLAPGDCRESFAADEIRLREPTAAGLPQDCRRKIPRSPEG